MTDIVYNTATRGVDNGERAVIGNRVIPRLVRQRFAVEIERDRDVCVYGNRRRDIFSENNGATRVKKILKRRSCARQRDRLRSCGLRRRRNVCILLRAVERRPACEIIGRYRSRKFPAFDFDGSTGNSGNRSVMFPSVNREFSSLAVNRMTHVDHMIGRRRVRAIRDIDILQGERAVIYVDRPFQKFGRNRHNDKLAVLDRDVRRIF